MSSGYTATVEDGMGDLLADHGTFESLAAARAVFDGGDWGTGLQGPDGVTSWCRKVGRDRYEVVRKLAARAVSGDPIHPEGIYKCDGCGRTYPEYVNGCVEDHGEPRKVRLVIPDVPASERTAGAS